MSEPMSEARLAEIRETFARLDAALMPPDGGVRDIRTARDIRNGRDWCDEAQELLTEVDRQAAALTKAETSCAAMLAETGPVFVGVKQEPDGCWMACLSSLTGIPLAEFPAPPPINGERDAGTRNAVTALLRSYGWQLHHLWTHPEAVPQGWAIAGGLSPRGVQHAILLFDGEPVWDPHESAAGLLSAEDYEVLVPVRPGNRLPRPPHALADDAGAALLVERDELRLICRHINDAIPTLTSERNAMREERDTWRIQARVVADTNIRLRRDEIAPLTAERDALRERVAALEAALAEIRPYAKIILGREPTNGSAAVILGLVGVALGDRRDTDVDEEIGAAIVTASREEAT